MTQALLELARRVELTAIEQTVAALSPEVPWDDADPCIDCAVKLFQIADALRARAGSDQ